MHLVSRQLQLVRVADESIVFEAGESIWTECSYKYDYRRLRQLVATAGFTMTRLWTDARKQFWVAFLEPKIRGSFSDPACAGAAPG